MSPQSPRRLLPRALRRHRRQMSVASVIVLLLIALAAMWLRQTRVAEQLRIAAYEPGILKTIETLKASGRLRLGVELENRLAIDYASVFVFDGL